MIIRPRAIAVGSLVMAVSSFLSATPQFVGSRYSVPHSKFSQSLIMNKSRDTVEDSMPGTISAKTAALTWKTMDRLCIPGELMQVTSRSDEVFGNLHTSKVTEENSDFVLKSNYWDDSNLYLFIALGSVLKGIGHSPLHPLGMSFIDDHATPRNSAVYIGVVSGLSLLGPAFGFILGSLTTRTWVDWGWVDSSKVPISPLNRMWVGAWWMGYLITGFLLLIATFPLCLFSRSIEKEQEDKESDSTLFCCFQACCTQKKSLSGIEQSEGEPLDHNPEKESQDSIVEERYKPDMFRNELNRRIDDVLMTEYEKPRNTHTGHGIESDTFRSVQEQDKCNACLLNHHRYSLDIRPENTLHNDKTISIGSPVGNLPSKDFKYVPKRHSIIRIDTNITDACPQDNRSNLAPGKIDARRRPSRLEKLALIDFRASFRQHLTDSVFLSITFGVVCLTSFLAASVTYVSKYMETQFSVTASFANLLNGAVNLPMVVVGNLLGGWLIRRFDLNVQRTMYVVVTGIFLTIVSVTVLLLFKCNDSSTESYSSGKDSGACSTGCNCEDAYMPVCDLSTNITYKSPCHAGCKGLVMNGQAKKYTDCGCLLPYNDDNRTLPTGYRLENIVPGSCIRPDCSQSHLPVFLGVMGTASLTAGVASTPSSLLILRIVPPAEKAFAIGIVFVFTRVLAWIPAPVYVGYIIDSACLRWSALSSPSEDGGSERHHCEMYDKDRLRSHFFAATGGLLVLSLLFYILAVWRHETRVRQEKKAQNIERKRILSFSNSPNFSNDSTPTDTLNQGSSSASMSTDSVNLRCDEIDECVKSKDRNRNEYFVEDKKRLVVSSALQKPFKIAISVSTPVIANQTSLDGRFCMAPPSIKNKSRDPTTIL